MKILLLILFVSILFIVNNANATEKKLVAAVLILEAGGETAPYAMEAVYEVICNRANKQNKSKYDIVRAKYQFSCLNGISDSQAINKAMKHPKWQKAIQIIENNRNNNITGGSNHYYADYIKTPYWAANKRPQTKIGRHIFFKL